MEFLDRCILCGDSAEKSFKPYCQKSGYQIVQCGNCGLIFVNPRDNLQLVLKQYQDDATSPIRYYQMTDKIDLLNFNKRLNWIETKMPKGRLLDIGCNVGTFMEAAKKRGWSVAGIEANGKAVEICRNKNLEVHAGLFNAQFVESLPNKNFDLVCLNDSIEHFTDPLEALNLTAALVCKNGFISISTPNIHDILAKVFQIKPKEHLFYFDKATLSKILNRCGLEVKMLVETGRRRDIGAMHYGASLDKKWLLTSKFLSASGLDKLIGIFLESLFKDELFALACKV